MTLSQITTVAQKLELSNPPPGANQAGPCLYHPSSYPVHAFLWPPHFTLNPKPLLRCKLCTETRTYMAQVNTKCTTDKTT